MLENVSIMDRKNKFLILEVLESSSAKIWITGKLVFNKQTSFLLCFQSSTRTGKILTGYELHSNNLILRLEWRVKDLRHAEGWKKGGGKKHKNKRKQQKNTSVCIMNSKKGEGRHTKGNRSPRVFIPSFPCSLDPVISLFFSTAISYIAFIPISQQSCSGTESDFFHCAQRKHLWRH